jgi:predicted metal-dependent hydrolase
MRERILNEWYRGDLKGRIPALLEKWEPAVGVHVSSVGIKKMKTRWGSCNEEARRIWVNLELAKKPPQCLEYVLVHELVHCLEPKHNERFRELMDQLMPRWRLHRDELNSAPLPHEDWRY